METSAPERRKIDRKYPYAKADIIVQEIIDTMSGYMPHSNKSDIDFHIRKAYLYARSAHEGQIRKSGDPYIIHPVEAAKELLILKPDIITVQSCFLHDVPEDTDRTVEEIGEVFGPEVAYITAGMEKLTKLKYRGEERTIGSLRKMFIAMSEDLRVIFVKLADRLHNMKTLEHHPDPAKRERIALETLNIYAPIADRLGIFEFKESLETECFRILYPEEYGKIKEELDGLKEEQQIFISKVKDLMLTVIPNNIPILDISYRIKSPYSIYKKMQRKGYDRVRDLYDLFALRLITDSIPHCYEILGTIHNEWTPVPKRFKDYIALPKENGYQSLHTTVIGLFKEFRAQPTEMQIRTLAMHQKAEIGVAAHFEYTERGKSTISSDIYWVTELKDIIQNYQDSEFMNQMKITIFDDRIFVFTPKGDVKNLPKGSTPIDFAYSVHSELGNHILSAKVNNKIVPLDYELKSGERVEIIIDKNKGPSITWLSFIKTTRAKDVIKNHINKEHRETLIEKGKFILNSHLLKHFGKTLDKELSLLKNVDGRILNTKEKEDLLLQIGNLSRKPNSLLKAIDANTFRIVPVEGGKHENKKDPIEDAMLSGKLIIGGEKNIPFKMAKCCAPIMGDKVVGYVTKTGVNIHKLSCSFLKRGSLDRCIPTYWEGMKQHGLLVKVEMLFENKIGVLRKLTDIFYYMNINIEEITQKTEEHDLSRIFFTLRLEEEDYYIYDRLLERVQLTIKELRESKLIEMR